MLPVGFIVLLGLPSSVPTRPSVVDPLGRSLWLKLRHFHDEHRRCGDRDSQMQDFELLPVLGAVMAFPPLRPVRASCQSCSSSSSVLPSIGPRPRSSASESHSSESASSRSSVAPSCGVAFFGSSKLSTFFCFSWMSASCPRARRRCTLALGQRRTCCLRGSL